MKRTRRIAYALFSLCSATALAQGLPPAVHEPTAAQTPPTSFALSSRATRSIALPAVPQEAITQFRAQRRAEANPGQPLRIGFARAVASEARTVTGSSLDWVAVPGGHAAKFDVSSPGALGLRAAIKVDGPRAGVILRFAGSIRADEVFQVAASETVAEPGYWGPVTQDDTQTIEVFVPSGVLPKSVRLAIESVMHLETFPGGPTTREIGDADSCERDIACRPNPTQQFLETAKAVARITYVSGGSSFLCSGTLVNNNQTPRAQTFITANHCISTQTAASTMVSYWFFDATGCGTNRAGDFKVVQGGATLLFNDTQRDHTLLQIRGALPAGVVFAGWTPQPIGANTQILGIHHPAGDLKKYSEGAKTRDVSNQIGLAGPFHEVVWSLGVTEGGSSGSGLFIFNSQFNNYQLVGQLLGGSSFCSRPRDPDVYGRFQDVYANVKRFLDTPAPALAVVSAASFERGPIAPEEVVSGFGAELPVAVSAASQANVCPTELGGRYSASVLANGQRLPACLLFIGGQQANIVLPKELGAAVGSTVTVEINDRIQNRVIASQFGVRVAAIAPGVFTATANGQGLPAANLVRVKPNGQQIYETVSDPRDPRQPVPVDLSQSGDQLFLVLYPTGVRGRVDLSSVKVTVAGIPAEVRYAGAQGEFFGLDQVNVRLPRDELIAAGVQGNKTIVELSIDQPDGTSVSAQPIDLYFR